MVFDIYNSNIAAFGPLTLNATGLDYKPSNGATQVVPVQADGNRSISFTRDVSVPRLITSNGIDVLRCLQIGNDHIDDDVFVNPIREVNMYDNVFVIHFDDGFLPPAPANYTSAPFDFTSLTVTATKPGQTTEVMTWTNGIDQSQTDAYRPVNGGPTNRLSRIRVTVTDANLELLPTTNDLHFKQGYTYTITWGAGAVPGYGDDEGLANNGSDTTTVAAKDPTDSLGLNMTITNFTTQHSAVRATMPSIPGVAYTRFVSGGGVFFEYQPGTISSGDLDFTKFTVIKVDTATGTVSDTFTQANGKITFAQHRPTESDFLLIFTIVDNFTYIVTWAAGGIGGDGWFSGSGNDGSVTGGSTTEHILPPDPLVPSNQPNGITKVTFNGNTVANSKIEFKAPHGTT